VIDITLEHPEYRSQRTVWQRYRDLYTGGEQFTSRGSEYLIRRQREPNDVYGERLERVFYENYVGSIIDWYGATLFRREPILIFEGDDPSARGFFNQFADNCDLRGTAISDFLRRQLIEALVLGRSYTVVDFPRHDRKPATRAEEEESGAARAYLTRFGLEQLTNWERNDQGDFEWTVLRTERPLNPGLAGGAWTTKRRWIYYDRQRFEIHEDVSEEGRTTKPALVDEGPHGLSRLNRVPVFEFAISDGLWLMNKAAGLQLEHFNKSNALSWALTMGLFAMPVVFSDREWNQVLGDSYYLQLAPGDKFGWTEPEGHVFEIALSNIDRLKEEIYRVCYLMSQAGGSLTKNAALSGLSKQRDYTVTQEVLRGYGDAVKDALKRLLRTIVDARQDRLTVDVSGLDEFDIGDFSDELADAASLLALGVQSPTLRKQLYKKLAFKYLCDVRQEVKDRIAQEIDSQD
jgi:hypothetical protein